MCVTLNVVTLSVVTLSVVTLSVVTLSVVTLSVVTLNVVTLSVVTLSVVILSVYPHGQAEKLLDHGRNRTREPKVRSSNPVSFSNCYKLQNVSLIFELVSTCFIWYHKTFYKLV